MIIEGGYGREEAEDGKRNRHDSKRIRERNFASLLVHLLFVIVLLSVLVFHLLPLQEDKRRDPVYLSSMAAHSPSSSAPSSPGNNAVNTSAVEHEQQQKLEVRS